MNDRISGVYVRRLLVAVFLFIPAAIPALVATSALAQRRLSAPHSGAGQLVSIEVNTNPQERETTLVAWTSSDDSRSELELSENGTTIGRWSFDGFLVKQARWATPTNRLVISGIGKQGSEDRLYEIASVSDPRLLWSSLSLTSQFERLSLSPSGTYWLGASFGEDSARIALGRVDGPSSEREWTLGAGPDRLTTFEVEQFSYAFLVVETEPSIGVLWGARLWISDPTTRDLVRMESPPTCDHIQKATPTRDGLWIQCHEWSAPAGERAHRWMLLPHPLEGGEQEPSLIVETFRDPRFHPDGTVLDVRKMAGEVLVFELDSSGTDLRDLGTLELPPEAGHARLIHAGDALVMEEADETYRVLPLQREIEALRAAGRPVVRRLG